MSGQVPRAQQPFRTDDILLLFNGEIYNFKELKNRFPDEMWLTQSDTEVLLRLFVLIGGLVGCVTGFAFPIYTVLDWPMITGGKPLISIPPFVVIAFELTILFGAIGGMLSFLVLSGLPRLTGKRAPDPRLTNDLTGISVTCKQAHVLEVRACLEHHGASEIRG